MKVSNKGVKKEKKYTDQYLTCPRCGALVPYQYRFRHPCFRKHLKEMEMDIIRMCQY